ncbi:MAG: Radical domain protein [Firmicutes bacterium]|nr:Radical domain protein [Bacillota bacterium]
MENLKEAMYYEKQPDGSTKCVLCPHNCMISPGRTGICGVRKNIGGVLYSLIYEKVSSIAFDPIEKKPLYKFHPGTFILSAGSVGCNFRCPFCQNYSIARAEPEKVETSAITSGQLVSKALSLMEQGNIGIAYTYNEPTIWYEYVYETARLAKEKGLVNVLVTNGFINPEPLENLLPYIDAMNIDLKGYSEGFYRDVVKGRLESVKNTIRLAAGKCHVEVTTLVIPGLNDSPEEMEEMAKWLASVSPDIPLHLSRFFPRYMMQDRPMTPIKTLSELENIASRYLNNVYMGNV